MTAAAFLKSYWTHKNWSTGAARCVNNWVSKQSERYEYKHIQDVKGIDKLINRLSNFTNINAKFYHLIGVITSIIAAVQEFFLSLLMIPVNILAKPITAIVAAIYEAAKKIESKNINPTDHPHLHRIREFVAGWEFSIGGHFCTGIKHGIAATSDLVSIFTTPSQNGLNRIIKEGLHVIGPKEGEFKEVTNKNIKLYGFILNQKREWKEYSYELNEESPYEDDSGLGDFHVKIILLSYSDSKIKVTYEVTGLEDNYTGLLKVGSQFTEEASFTPPK